MPVGLGTGVALGAGVGVLLHLLTCCVEQQQQHYHVKSTAYPSTILQNT